MFKNFSNVATPKPGDDWLAKSESERIWELRLFCDSSVEYKEFKVISAQDNGHVTIAIDHNIPANVRGLFLLDMENKLKEKFDAAITLWCEPVGDKSKLRALRGVQISTQ